MTTTTATTAECPVCAGALLPDDPRGPLAVQHRAWCSLLAAEDATQAADHQRGPTLRPATATERALLLALHDVTPPAALETRVEYPSPGVRRRTWPTLPTLTPEPERTTTR